MGVESSIKLPYLTVSMTGLPDSRRQQHVAERSSELLRSRSDIGYGDEARAVIGRAFHIASAHEMNGVENRRIRKFDKEPYILHPLAMAQEAMRMRQHPTIVAACLMHDVPEDVELGTLQSADQWMKHIDSAFAGYADRDRLMRILRAELKTESFDGLEQKEEVVNSYTETSLGKTAMSYLRQLRGDESTTTPRDREHIAEVLYDLNRIMSDSYIAKDGGEKEFDPSILIVKILDTWQNLQTPGFWKTQLTTEDRDAKTVAKLMRARILTNIAEFFGMRKVASEMTQVIAAIHDVHNVDYPLLKKLEAGKNGEDLELDNRREAIATRMNQANSIIPRLRGMLGMRSDENMEAVLQMPWAVAQQDADAFTAATGQVMYHIRGSDDPAQTWISTASDFDYAINSFPLPDTQAIRALFYRQMGRLVHDHELTDTKKNIVIARVRAEAPSARYISTTKDPSFKPPSPNAVPERKLFHPDVCKYTTKTKEESAVPDALKGIDVRFVRFLEFMLSPQTFLTHANGEVDRPYVIMMNGKVFLSANTTDVTLWDMAEAEGIRDPQVRAASTEKTSGNPILKGDQHILDRMVIEGNLPQRIVIVEAGAPKKEGTRKGTVFPS